MPNVLRTTLCFLARPLARPRSHRYAAFALAIAALLIEGSVLGDAHAVLPTGFQSQLIVAHTFPGDPIAFAPLPDGRFLIIDRNLGNVRLAPVGSGTSVLIHTIPDVQAAGNEQGLLGIAVDPDWPARPYVYFYYTHTGNVAYLTMYTASGDLTIPTSPNITLGSPFFLFTDLPDVNNYHNSGTLRFAPDKTLLLTLGDDGNLCGAQNLDLFEGKLLRLNVSAMPGAGTGPPPKADLIPPGNPFHGPGDIRQLVYAWGLRNPFRFTVDPLSGDLVIGDVGEDAQEEVDILFAASPGSNFGWPQMEGFGEHPCCGLCGQENTFTDPIFAYNHDVPPKAVIAGPRYRYNGSAARRFPPQYDNNIFFAEFYDGWIRRLVNTGGAWAIAPPVPGQPSAANWADGLAFHSDIQQGSDGALYLMRMFGNSRGIYRISAPVGVGADPNLASSSGTLQIEPSPLRAGQSARIHWSGTQAIPAALVVQDVSGRIVRKIPVHASDSAALDLVWNGLSDRGERLSSGVYFFRLESSADVIASAKVVILR